MPHVKGIKRDGFICVDDNVDFRGTVAGVGDGAERSFYSLDFYVDGTYGRDANSGKSWQGAFKTIQAGISAQIAQTKGMGDRIFVAAGNYAEDLEGNLTKVQLIGATCGGTPEVTSIRPTAGSAYTGIMENASIRGFDFRQSSTNPEQAVLEITDMLSSVISNCAIIGTTDDEASCGILIGSDSEAAAELMFNSGITHCLFTTHGARSSESFWGIKVGNGSTNNATRKFTNSYINHNRIFAEDKAILIDIADNNGCGSEIAYNTVGSNQANGAATNGICSERTNNDVHVHSNRVVAANNLVLNFTNSNANFGVLGGTADIDGWYE